MQKDFYENLNKATQTGKKLNRLKRELDEMAQRAARKRQEIEDTDAEVAALMAEADVLHGKMPGAYAGKGG